MTFEAKCSCATEVVPAAHCSPSSLEEWHDGVLEDGVEGQLREQLVEGGVRGGVVEALERLAELLRRTRGCYCGGRFRLGHRLRCGFGGGEPGGEQLSHPENTANVRQGVEAVAGRGSRRRQ